MTFLYAQFVKNKVKITNIEACMLIVNSRKASLRIKLTLGQVLAEQIFCFFSFQGRFFPKHALKENGQKGLVCRREPTVML